MNDDAIRAVPVEILNRLLGENAADGYLSKAAKFDVVEDDDAIVLFPVHKDGMPSMTMLGGVPVYGMGEEDDTEDEEGEEDHDHDHEEMTGDMTARQLAVMAANESICYEYGCWPQSEAHYMEENPFNSQGMNCANCVAFEGGGSCEWVEGDIKADALCKLWVIPNRLLLESVSKELVKKGNKWEVMSKDGSRSFGTYPSKEAAQKRLDQVHRMAANDSKVVKSVTEERFTLAPWYVPGQVDAHGEWTDAAELQKGLWRYVREADRDIRLQHNTSVKAGEWLEAVTWPFEIEVPMQKSTGGVVDTKFPANTVFLGVQWEPWAWELVKEGKINGYSVGGKGKRLLVDFNEEGSE